MDERELDAQQESPENQGLLAEPRTRFVNYRWLNVRQKPSLPCVHTRPLDPAD